MYHEVPVKKLSHNQVLKLLKGERIRVAHGHGHKLHLSEEQHKKVMRAAKKSAGVTIQLDPYQREMHRSHGFFGDVGKTLSSIAHSPIAQQLAPVAIDLGKKYLEKKLEAHGEGVRRRARKGKGAVHHHLMHGCGDAGGRSHGKKSEGVHHAAHAAHHAHHHAAHAAHHHEGGALFGGALMPAGYGEGRGRAAAGRKRGKGINGKQIVDGLIHYGLPALQTASMFL